MRTFFDKIKILNGEIDLKIILNGETYHTFCKTVRELLEELKFDTLKFDEKAEYIFILNGYQESCDANLKEGDELFYFNKNVMPPKEQWEKMICARHTPGIYEKVKKAKVAIAGLGGLGSNIAMMLARTGIGHLHLVDFDTVDLTNLNRQQYNIGHIGHLKTEALKEQLLNICPFLDIRIDTVYVTRDNALNLFQNDDIVCEAFDNAECKAMLTEELLSKWKGKALIAASGMAGYGNSNDIKTRKIRENFYICGDEVTSARQGMGLIAPRVTLCAAHQANLVLDLIIKM